MIHERQLLKVESQVQDARIVRSARDDGRDSFASYRANFYRSDSMADVSSDMRIMREETFGPILTVMHVR